MILLSSFNYNTLFEVENGLVHFFYWPIKLWVADHLEVLVRYNNIDWLLSRYIEIFRSSLSERNGAVGPNRRMNSGPSMGYNSRPAPYDRGDRFGGANRFQPSNNRSSRNFKGTPIIHFIQLFNVKSSQMFIP